MAGKVHEKSFTFAVKVVAITRQLRDAGEYVLSRQLLRAGTAIGAQVREAEQAESRADFIHKMAVALKEANETAYWLELLATTGYISKEGYATLYLEVRELLKLLTAIIRSTRARSRSASSRL